MSVHDSAPARAALALVLATTLAACGTSAPSATLDGEGASASKASEGGPVAADAEESADTTGTGDDTPAEAPLSSMAAALPPPSCADLAATPSQGEGPFYTADTPERDDLREPGDPGTALRVVGYVLDSDCTPLPGAMLDIWQTDDAGDYDNEGYGYRGHVLTDEAGAYAFTTILPGTYPGRPRHIHLRIHAPGAAEPTLTSQLYFSVPNTEDDAAGVDPALVVELSPAEAVDGLVGRFDFVLDRE